MPRSAETSVTKAAAYFKRSGSSQISLKILGQAVLESEEISSLMRRYHGQLEHITLTLIDGNDKLLAPLAGCQFTSLSSLCLGCPLQNGAADMINLFRRNSSITRLICYSPTVSISSPWPSLTELELRNSFSTDSICDILSQCPELRVVRVRFRAFNESSDSTIVRLSKLEDLGVSQPGAIFRRLEAPLLQKLRIQQSLYRHIPRGHDALDKFLVRSQCKLKHLELFDDSISDSSLIQYLRLPSLQSLTSLVIRGPTLSKQVLRCFAAPEGAYGVVPLMESLAWGKCALPAGTLEKVFASRLPQLGYAPLKSLTLKMPKTNHADTIYLDSLVATGTSVCLTS
ncbi:hypothetical protein EYR36_001676 [Pleurotus pulmonarius]|nr:hypothetical protein EYR36_001676 [Pleurotus pulmonarius]